MAYATVFFNEHVIISMYIYIYTSFLMLAFHINNHPLMGRFLHTMELVNEVFILQTSYYLLMFSEFIQDVEVKYAIGFFYTPNLMAITSINILLVCVDLVLALRFAYQKLIHRR